MIYPAFLKTGSLIGIAAPSAGVGDKLNDYETSLSVLHSQGWKTAETPSVRSPEPRSNTPEKRGEELTSLFLNKDVDFVLSAAGGDFLNEMIPYFDFSAAAAHPKWMMGASDPTGILYPLTTKYDIAAMYGMNAGSFDLGTEWDYIANALHFMNGTDLTEETFPRHMAKAKFMVDTPAYDTDTVPVSGFAQFHVSGRCIGGCIDVLKDLIGTPFDGTADFVDRYADDGQIFFFDNFSMSAENFYRTLKQFAYAGWFRHTKAVIIGRTLFASSETGMTYKEAADLALPDLPVIMEADVGHTIPCWVMLTGAMLDLDWHDNKAHLSFTLK